jgi:predicted MFS family arabinose efflux permease
MGLIGAAFGLGFTIGPLLGGVLAGIGSGELVDCVPGLGPAVDAAARSFPRGQLALPIWVAAGLSAVNFVSAVLFLPETRHAASPSGAHRSISPAALLRTVGHPVVGLCVLLNFVQVFAFALMESTFSLFAITEHCLTPGAVGRLFGAVGVVGIVVQGGLIGRLVKRFGEAPLVPVGIALVALGLAWMPFVPVGPWMPVDFALVALGQGLVNPSLSALVSRGTRPEEQGAVLGSNQSMAALARATGPALGGLLFGRWHASPFLLAAGLLGAGALFAIPATARAVRRGGGV